METVEITPESPATKSKKHHTLDAIENGDNVEYTKSKRKSTRNKAKSQINGSENGEFPKQEYESNQEPINSCYTEKKDFKEKNDNGTKEKEKKEGNKLCEFSAVNDNLPINEINGKSEKSVSESITNNEKLPTIEVSSNTDGNVNGGLQEGSNATTEETESSAKDDNVLGNSVLSEEVSKNESITEKSSEKDMSFTDNGTQHNEFETCTSTVEVINIGINGSDSKSHNENLSTENENNIQASPDTFTKEENKFSQKISNFFEKWNSSPSDQKQDSEISSSKISKDSFISYENIPHPYLSKVTGRRGIRERTSSDHFNFSFNEEEMKTPKNSGVSLNDSFRVRTDPPRLNPSDLQETSTLRKFSGKRCLNATDEPEEDKNENLTSAKRQKLIEKTSESGFLGNILFSPFKKKPLDNEEVFKLKTSESKLSRFLSPFWFWKKSAAIQKTK